MFEIMLKTYYYILLALLSYNKFSCLNLRSFKYLSWGKNYLLVESESFEKTALC